MTDRRQALTVRRDLHLIRAAQAMAATAQLAAAVRVEADAERAHLACLRTLGADERIWSDLCTSARLDMTLLSVWSTAIVRRQDELTRLAVKASAAAVARRDRIEETQAATAAETVAAGLLHAAERNEVRRREELRAGAVGERWLSKWFAS